MCLQPAAAGDLGPRAAVATRSAAPWVLPSHPHAPAGLRGRACPPCRPPCRPPGPAHTPRAHLPLGNDVSIQAHPLGLPAYCRVALCLLRRVEGAFREGGRRHRRGASGGPSSPAWLSWGRSFVMSQSWCLLPGYIRERPDGTEKETSSPPQSDAGIFKRCQS